ncbi:glutathione S-transferase family protein [Sphingosinicella sp. CPCC 101087]|uniref:glutathione S-transferase family protein n=1 Tax=Sphingosinicella sp. CPCC 101087 TaxID=2497754 RepID=UPI001FB1424D|nr:glutathione S-transferase N-terminal domain-containing protein [Sphingosinicella sp. CPCC 101087]
MSLDPAQFEHHEVWFEAINPNGQAPALVDGGRVITGSTVICEYLGWRRSGCSPKCRWKG